MNFRIFVFSIFFAALFCGACTSKYNIVKSRNDKYLNSTFFTLATGHRAERQGGRFNSSTHVEVDYFKETKAGNQLKNEIKFNVSLHTDDTNLNDKGVLLVNGKTFEIAIENVNVADKSFSTTHKSSKPVTLHQGGKVYQGTQETTEVRAHNYKIASFKISPVPTILAELRNPSSFSVRLYLGTEAITVDYDEEQLAAVRKFYTDVADEDAGQAE